MHDFRHNLRQTAWQGYPTDSPSVRALSGQYNLQSSAPLTPPRSFPSVHAAQSLGVPPLQTRSLSRDESGGSFSASPSTTLTPTGFPCLKRPYSDPGTAYSESAYDGGGLQVVQSTTSSDSRLLSFHQVVDKVAIVDQSGQIRPIEIQVDIRGMFFLSELTTQRPDDENSQPELTCYRRNLFQVSGNIHAPRGPLFLAHDNSHIRAIEVLIKSTDASENKPVQLVVIPWKTTPPNSPELYAGPNNEPIAITLVPSNAQQQTADGSNDVTVYRMNYKRLQFRAATNNNGRRKELQQRFLLHLTVTATLDNGTKVDLAEAKTAPIVVRGRSPRNFANKQGFSLAGTAVSRGPGPDPQTSMRNGCGSRIATKVSSAVEPQVVFNYEASHLPEPLPMRLSSHRSWDTNASNIPTPASRIGMSATDQVRHDYQSPPSGMSDTLPPLRTNYPYHATMSHLSQGYGYQAEGSQRPTKSPRHETAPVLQYPSMAGRYASSQTSTEGLQGRQYYSMPQQQMPSRAVDETNRNTVPAAYHGNQYSYGQATEARDNPTSPSAPSNYPWGGH